MASETQAFRIRVHLQPTFTTAGTFTYFCSPHGLCRGMVGSVTVNAPLDLVTLNRAQYTTYVAVIVSIGKSESIITALQPFCRIFVIRFLRRPPVYLV